MPAVAGLQTMIKLIVCAISPVSGSLIVSFGPRIRQAYHPGEPRPGFAVLLGQMWCK